MNKLLLIIDVQQDFINENTKEYVDKIESLIKIQKFNYIAFTKFINSEESTWYKEFNYHGCLTEEGQKIVINTENYKVFEKKIYSALTNEFKEYLNRNNITEVYLCGFDTDACILKTALDLFENNSKVFVLKDYCMSSAGENVHDYAIDSLKRLIGNDKIITLK